MLKFMADHKLNLTTWGDAEGPAELVQQLKRNG